MSKFARCGDCGVRHLPEGAECSECIDLRRRSFGNMNFGDLQDLRKNSDALNEKFMDLRKDAITNPEIAKGKRSEKVNTELYVRKKDSDYKNVFQDYERWPLDEFCEEQGMTFKTKQQKIEFVKARCNLKG